MVISERIFELIEKRGISQKYFSEQTGIAQSTISDWKRKKTSPVSEKILTICHVLQVTPEELLSGTDGEGKRSNESDYIIVDKSSEIGTFLMDYQKLDKEYQQRMIGYMRALQELRRK